MVRLSEVKTNSHCVGSGLAEKFEDFFRSINMPVGLKGLGLDFGEEECRRAALGVTFQNARTIGNFKVLDTEDIYKIYMMAAGR